jgi:hypothetical protein
MSGPGLHVYVDQLAKAHGFTMEELAANRARQIHAAQIARARGKGTVSGVVLVILSLLALAGGVGGALLLHADLRPPVSQVDMNGVYMLAGGGVVVALGLAAGALATFVGVSRRRGAYARNEIAAVDGPAQKLHVRRGSNNWYRCTFSGRTFEVSREAFELVNQGLRYRVYFVRDELLSLEPI